MKAAWVLGLLSAAVWAQSVPPEKGSQPGWDSGTPIESAFTRCRSCHDRDSTPEPALYMPFDGWVSSMMGNSQRDPLFRAAVTVANQDVPDIGQWCLRCHSPQAYVTGHVLPADAGAFAPIDFEGVTCDVCHRSGIPANEPGAPFVGNAQLYLETSNQKLGPYPDLINSAHEGLQSSFTGSSELCGQCHSVHNPVGAWRDADGGTLGPRFPLDTTYEEWKQSSFAKLPADAGFASCADCHLPRFTGLDGGTGFRIAKLGNVQQSPRQHVLVGGNVWGLDAVQAANPQLASDFAEQFAQTRELTLENLKRAATVELFLPIRPPSGVAATVRVRVTNRTGHKLPTGYADGRRMVIQLLVDGTPVTGGFDAGALLVDPQLHVYEVVHGKFGQGAEEHLALHDLVMKDSRIPPAGFTATAQTQPVGVTWFDQADGGAADFDDAIFRIPLNRVLSEGAKVKVTARLLYQSTTPQYVQFLAAENHTDGAGQRLLEIYEATGRGAPIELAKVEGEVIIGPRAKPLSGCGCGSAPGGGLAVAVLLGLLALRVRNSPRKCCVPSKNQA